MREVAQATITNSNITSGKVRTVQMRLTFLASLLILAACSPQGQQDASQAKPGSANGGAPSAANTAQALTAFQVESASPDQALKTWWRYRDLVEEEALADCQRRDKEAPPAHTKLLPQLANGEVLEASKIVSGTCTKNSYSREINEVKMESETRAIAFATLKNASPIPPGTEPSDLERKWRNEGFKFKYVFEKSEAVWKLVQIYRFDEGNRLINRDVWEKQYIVRTSVDYPSYVVHP